MKVKTDVDKDSVTSKTASLLTELDFQVAHDSGLGYVFPGIKRLVLGS